MSSPSMDRTWPLNIDVALQQSAIFSGGEDHESITIRVRGDYTIGAVMALIGEKVGPKQDWSDYALWWPDKKRWLKHCRMTLDQVDVRARDTLHFTSMHKILRIQFPDLNIIECKVNISVNVLNAVSQLCQENAISHPEELSFAKPLSKKDLKRNNPNMEGNSFDSSTLRSKSNNYSNDTINRSNGSLTSYGTIASNGSMNGSSPSLSSIELRDSLLPHPKSSVERARLNSAWLNSSISLYEQDISAYDLILLRFKFYTFFDLKPTELSRVNYLYEQLKWAILREEISCTEDEAYTLAAIMLQVEWQSGMKSDKVVSSLSNGHNGNGIHNGSSPKLNGLNGNGYHQHSPQHLTVSYGDLNGNGYQNHKANGSISSMEIDEVDCALESLEKQLEGSSIGSNELNGRMNGRTLINPYNKYMVEPQLAADLKISKQNKETMSPLARIKSINSEKTYFVIFRQTNFKAYQLQDYDKDLMMPKQDKYPKIDLDMTNCEVYQDLLASQQKYCFRIIESNGSSEYCIRCQNDSQYAQWYTACKQASLGYTMAHSSYSEEYQNTLKLLKVHSTLCRKKSNLSKQDLKSLCEKIDPNRYVPPRFLRKRSKEQIIGKIKTAHDMFKDDSLILSQMNFIKTCQKLKDYAITLFVVRFIDSKKEELLGVMPDKLVLIDINNGMMKKHWRYKTMMEWNINWEVKHMTIYFEKEKIEFSCLSADCKVIHEFIGGYIYMSMRNDQQQFDEEQFLRLTGGWNDEFEIDDEHIAMCRREAWANQHTLIRTKSK